ncbi:MAG: hypothetical protein R6U37_00805 [Dehalococcoidia bacterium]
MDFKQAAKIALNVIILVLILFVMVIPTANHTVTPRASAQSSCPSGCDCLPDETAEKEGLSLCNGQLIECLLSSGLTTAPQYGHCYETEECPAGCTCMTRAEGVNHELCNGTVIECNTDAGDAGLCYEAEEVTECPVNCDCLTDEEAEEQGLDLCNDQLMLCQLSAEPGAAPQYGHCYEKPECPEGCTCMTQDEGAAYNLCNNKLSECITAAGATGLCYEPYEVSECPVDCGCLSDETAAEEGLELCGDLWIRCPLSSGQTTAPQYGHCYEIQECPANCTCITEDEGANHDLCNGILSHCITAAGALGFCYEPYEPTECPDGCTCMTEAEGANHQLCNSTSIECITVAGATGLCYESEEMIECPADCGCLTDEKAEEEGLELCNDQWIRCQLPAEPSVAPQYGHCYEKPEATGVCGIGDIDLRQVYLRNGEIRFISDTDCKVNRTELLVGGEKVKECAGSYCEYLGGPFEETPAFSVNLYDDSGNEMASPEYVARQIAVGLVDIPQLGEYEPCPFCPEPEEGWGECISQECEGINFPQVYDGWSHVQLTACNYENHSLTGGQVINLGEGMTATMQIADPVFDYCVDNNDIALHWCQNGARIVEYTYTCPYGCDNDRCICSDTDGGMNYFQYGGVRDGETGLVAGAADYCLNENILREYYTEIDYEDNTCIIKSADFECPGVCRDGACHGTCNDGIQNEGEAGIDCGSPCLAACEYDIGWYPQNYGFSFSNPAGQDLSYGDCWSTAGSCGKGYGHYKDTFGNCEVCICHCFGCCCGWHVHAGLYYVIYKYLGASEGQCTGMSLSSLKFYYGNQDVQDYDSLASEVRDLDRTGSLKEHIAARQGKVLSGENIDHYLFHSNYWGANDVLGKVEDALDNDPPDYGMIFVIEDNGWGGWRDTVRQTPSAHTVVATNVEHINNTTAKIYLYDSNIPVEKNPTAVSPYFSISNSPYIEINKQSNTYTYVDEPNSPPTDNEGEPWSNSNDELFDRIGYIPYSKLSSDVDIPWEWDLLIIGIVGAIGSADAQVEDSNGGILGFSEDGPNTPAIENGMILPVFGEPGPETPPVFNVPMGDYKVHLRGVNNGTYSAYIIGDSPDAFAVQDVPKHTAGTDRFCALWDGSMRQ